MYEQMMQMAGDGDGAGREGRSYEVGWLFAKDKASIIWDAPKPVRQQQTQSTSSKSVAFCPAVVEFDRRHMVINCPVDLHLRLTTTADGKINITNLHGDVGSLRSNTLNQMIGWTPQHEWRHASRPVMQITTPFLFISDDPVYVNQFPPFLHYMPTPRPGIQLCGRYPINIWPRQLMWAFEWHDMSKDLILKRGDPWFYVRFEGPDPAASVRLVEAEMTPDLQGYIDSITDVTNYVNRTFSLFKTAQERRPPQLLVAKKRK